MVALACLFDLILYVPCQEIPVRNATLRISASYYTHQCCYYGNELGLLSAVITQLIFTHKLFLRANLAAPPKKSGRFG